MHHRYRETMATCGMLVVAIGLLVPVWRRAAAKGACVNDCASNANQISRALLLYAEDYDQTLPQAWFDGDGGGGYTPHGGKVVDGNSDYAWAYALFEYTMSFQMFTCHEFPDDQNWDGRIAPAVDGDGISYGLNSRLGEAAWRLAGVSRPSHTVAVCELAEGLREPWAGLPDAGNDPLAGSVGNIVERVRDNHHPGVEDHTTSMTAKPGYTVVGFCDGHVKAMRKAPLLATGPGHNVNLWQPDR